MIDKLILLVWLPLFWAGTYMVTFPNSLISGVELDVRVHVLQASGIVNVTAQLKHVANDSVITSVRASVTEGVPSTVKIPIPEGLQASKYKISVSGTGGAVFSNESYISYESNNLFMFIQTDKTRYSGGQEVKYRAILIHPNLHGYKGPVTLTVYDGKSNRIVYTEHPTTNEGVVSGRLVLSREPVFGKWLIEVRTALKTVTKSFEVNDYAVPKFSVTILIPNNITASSTLFDVSVKARFTYNADVFGNCTVQIYEKSSGYVFLEDSKMIVGEANFTFSSAAASYYQMIVRALVTDNATSLTIVTEEELFKDYNSYINYYLYPRRIKIRKLDQRDTFIPGLIYHTPIFVGKENEPIGTSGEIHVKHTLTVVEEKDCLINYPPYKWLDQLTISMNEFTISVDQSGYATLNIPISKHANKLEFELTYEYTRKTFTMYAVSSNPVMMIASSVNKVQGSVGEKVTILTEATALVSGTFVYEIYSKGILLRTETLQVYNTNFTTFLLELTPEMVPQAYVIVTHVTSWGQLLSDYVTLKIRGSPFKNKISVLYNTTSLRPGQDVEMIVKADPNSTVYILVEDENNRLTGSENDIFFNEVTDVLLKTSHDIEENLQSIGNVSRRKRQQQPSVLTKLTGTEPFYESGVVILSDISFFPRRNVSDLLMFNTFLPRECVPLTTTLYPTTPTRGYVTLPKSPESFYPGASEPLPTFTPINPLGPFISPMEILRTRFPETWIWEEHKTGDDGRFKWVGSVPDSITTWTTSVFATNVNSGFGITETKKKITVTKDIFLSVDMPESIILGEEILVQITVFNYLSTTQQIFLQVIKSDDPTNPIPAASLVNPNKGRSTWVKVAPTQLGELKIIVQARAGFSSLSAFDALEKSVFVRPRGVFKTTNHQRLVSVQPGGVPFTDTLIFTDPPDIVPGTKSIRLKITGDMIVPFLSGLQHLVNMPVGCGEQSMVNVAQEIFTMKYLNLTGQLTKQSEDRAESMIISGYQHELRWKRRDGSFSIWGEGDSYGSTWLTAYVVKCFHQAKEFVTTDDSVLSTSVDWLLKMQNTDGSFWEAQDLYHHNNTETEIQLSAFTLVTLLEIQQGPLYTSAVLNAINKGIIYLESKLSSISEAYTLSMVCYTLAQSNSTYGNSCLSKLEAARHIDGNMVFWIETSPVFRRSNTFNRQVNLVRARDIETTAYALLTYIALGYHSQALPIVQWLVSQRNPNGVFQSTQDSVIAIQALTEYALAQSHTTTNYGVQINAFGVGFVHTYSASQKEYQGFDEVEIPANLSNIFIQAIGQGVAVIDVIQSFYVSSNASGQHISVMATIEYESLNSLTVNSTVSWTGLIPSHMIMVEVEMPTGFVPDNDFFRNQQLIRRHETNGRIIALYLDGIHPNGNVSVSVKMNRADPVVKTQACHITVYDYYEPTEQAMTIYESGLLKSAEICDVCPLCNLCTDSSLFSQIGIGK